MRFTSYSNGPGSVSSKSFRSNSSVPLGRGKHAEVRQMGVAAELNRQAGPGRVLEVGGHDLGRTPVEGERRDHHPPVADRHQVGLTRGVLLLEQSDRIGAVRGRLPTRMPGRRHVLPRLLTLRPPLLDTRVLHSHAHGLRSSFPGRRWLRRSWFSWLDERNAAPVSVPLCQRIIVLLQIPIKHAACIQPGERALATHGAYRSADIPDPPGPEIVAKQRVREIVDLVAVGEIVDRRDDPEPQLTSCLLARFRP